MNVKKKRGGGKEEMKPDNHRILGKKSQRNSKLRRGQGFRATEPAAEKRKPLKHQSRRDIRGQSTKKNRAKATASSHSLGEKGEKL